MLAKIEGVNYTAIIGESAKIDVKQAINYIKSGQAEIAETVGDIIGEFNDNAVEKTNTFNQNAIDKTAEFDLNASNKTGAFNTNATNKTTDYNDNATSKTGVFDSNAVDKTNAFNENYEEKKALVDESANTARKWAEGTDGEVTPLGGTHSSKGWAEIAEQAASGVQNPANRDLSNLTNTGSLVIDTVSGYLSNCITAIPENIKVELNNGILTLKSGSVVYYPNGVDTFDVYTTKSDLTSTISGNGVWVVALGTSHSIFTRKLENCVSGAGATTTAGYAYDTTTNKLAFYDNSGNIARYCSFPFAIVTVSGGAITSIDKVFNGTGYIGHHAFVLPGVTGLIPNGFNNGKFKSIYAKITSVKVQEMSTTPYASKYSRAILLNNDGGLNNNAYVPEIALHSDMIATNALYQYCVEDNFVYNYSNSTNSFNTSLRVCLVEYDYDGTTITRFDVHKPLDVLEKSTLNVADYGVVGNGIIDNTAAIQNVINLASANDTIYFPQGEYIISDVITCNKPLNLVGDGAIMKCAIDPATDKAMFDFPTLQTLSSTTATANITKEDKTITVTDASIFSVGDYITLENEQYWDGIEGIGGFRIETKGEINQIQYINGNTIYLAIPAQDTYDNTNYPVTVTGFKHYEDISIKGITFIGTGGGNTHTSDNPHGGRALQFVHCSRIAIIGCKFINFPRVAIYFNTCTDTVVDANVFIGSNPADTTNAAATRSLWFTGIYCQGCLNFAFVGNTGAYLRRMFDCDCNNIVTRNMTVSGNSATSCRNLIGTHGCDNVSIVGNTGTGCLSGIALRGKNAVICNNNVTSSDNYGIQIGSALPAELIQDYSDTDSPSAGRVVISGNKMYGGTEGIKITVDVDNIIIANNDIQNVTTHGINFINRRIGGAKITGNTITDVTENGINIANFGTDRLLKADNIVINNNTVENCKIGVLVAGSSASSKTENLMVNNNVLTNCSVQGVRFGGDGNTIISGYFGDKSMIANNIINATTAISIETANFDTVPTQSNNI